MNVFNVSSWTLWYACLLMLIAGVINAWSLMVPNRFTFGSLGAGVLVALAISVSPTIPSRGGGIPSSVAAIVIAFVLLIPFYASGLLGAGCVKMQMAFGAWVGCGLGFQAAAIATGIATLAGAVLTTLAVLVVIVARRLRSQGEPSSSPGLFPAQVTLSLGSIGGLLAAGWSGWY